MTPFFHKAEIALNDYAEKFTPDGTLPQAIIHQWLHAIANGNNLFFASEQRVNSKKIMTILGDADITLEEIRESISTATHIKPSNNPMFTFVDLFAGIGGMRIGFQKAGGQCVFSSEFEKNAQSTYFENHAEYPFGDITKINPKDIPDHDVLVGGFPCQPFSHAGFKLGIEDTRGTLFYSIAKILETKKPLFALLENVKGLVSHEHGRTLHVILQTLTSIGYRCTIPQETINDDDSVAVQNASRKMILKSIDFGIPQNRQRIYIILWREGLIENFDYPRQSTAKTCVGDILEKKVSESFTISDKLWRGHQRRRVENAANGKGFGFGIVNKNSPYTNTISARYYKDGSEILIDQPGKNPRKLTPREAANLQGFPKEFIINKSKVQAYKQFGNSVTVPVIAMLANGIAKKLEGSKC